MSTNHNAPLALTVPARVTVNLAGHDSAAVPFTVSNSGTQPLNVTLSAADLNAKSQAFPGATWVTSIAPASFRLAPGQARTAHLTITVPVNAAGVHYANLEALASATGKGEVHVGGAVASSLVLERPGHAVPVAPPSHATPWLNPTLIGVTGVALVAAALAAATGLRWRRLRRRNRLTAIRAHRLVASGHHRAGSR